MERSRRERCPRRSSRPSDAAERRPANATDWSAACMAVSRSLAGRAAAFEVAWTPMKAAFLALGTALVLTACGVHDDASIASAQSQVVGDDQPGRGARLECQPTKLDLASREGRGRPRRDRRTDGRASPSVPEKCGVTSSHHHGPVPGARARFGDLRRRKRPTLRSGRLARPHR